MSVCLTVQSLKIQDLSPSGSLHSNVAWKKIPLITGQNTDPSASTQSASSSAFSASSTSLPSHAHSHVPQPVSKPIVSLTVTVPGSSHGHGKPTVSHVKDINAHLAA